MALPLYLIDDSRQVLIDKSAPGVEVHALTAPEGSPATLDYMLEALADLDDDERAKMADVLGDGRIAKDAVATIVSSDGLRKIVIPYGAATAENLADFVTTKAATWGLGRAGSIALHGVLYTFFKDARLTYPADQTAIRIVTRRNLLPSLRDLERDMVRARLIQNLALASPPGPAVASGLTSITARTIEANLTMYLRQLSIALQQAPRLIDDFYTVLAYIRQYVSNETVSTWRESRAPFPSLVNIQNFVILSLDKNVAPKLAAFELTSDLDFRWALAADAVQDWVSSKMSRFRLIGSREYASFFDVQRIHHRYSQKYHFVHIGRRSDPRPQYAALAVHKLDMKQPDTAVLSVSERTSTRIADMTNGLFAPLFSSPTWTNMAEHIIGRGDVERDVQIVTASRAEWLMLAHLNCDGLKVVDTTGAEEAEVEYQYTLDEDNVHRRHVELPDTKIIGSTVFTPSVELAMRTGILPRQSEAGVYPVGLEAAHGWLGAALVYMDGLRLRDLAKTDSVKFTVYADGGKESTAAVSISFEDAFSLSRADRKTWLFEPPVVTRNFAMALAQAIGIAWTVWDHPTAYQLLGAAVAQPMLNVIGAPEILNATHEVLKRQGIRLRGRSDLDAALTLGHAAVAVVNFALQNIGQVDGALVRGFRTATSFDQAINTAQLATLLLSMRS